MNRHNYLECLKEQIRYKKMRSVIAAEIEEHIEEQKKDFMVAGMSEDEAEEAAVREMGDPVEVGVEMDRIHRPKMPWGAIAVIGVMEIIGFLFFLLFYKEGVTNAISCGKVLVLMVTGFLLMILVCYMDYSWIGKYAKYLAGGYLVALFIGRYFLGLQVNGATRWFHIGRISMNISIMSWLFIPLYGAVLYGYRGDGYKAIFKSALWMVIPTVLLVRSPDMMMAATLGLSCCIMLMMAVYKGWYQVSGRKILMMIGTVTFLIPAGIFTWIIGFGPEYQKLRVLGMIGIRQEAVGGSLANVRYLLSASKMLGKSSKFNDFGNSVFDYMLLGIGNYCGILVMVGLVVIIAGLLCWFLRSTLKQRNQLGMIMGFGCVTVLGIQFVLSIISNFGISVLGTGAWCLFFGVSGTGIMISGILLGVLLSIYRHQSVTPELFIAKKLIED